MGDTAGPCEVALLKERGRKRTTGTGTNVRAGSEARSPPRPSENKTDGAQRHTGSLLIELVQASFVGLEVLTRPTLWPQRPACKASRPSSGSPSGLLATIG